jgi:hypothetical protein
MRQAVQLARMREMRHYYEISVRKPEGKRQLGRLRRRWREILKSDLVEIESGFF